MTLDIGFCLDKSGKKWKKVVTIMYFRGRSLRSLDPKGRLMLPPEFRESLLARGRKGGEGDDDGKFVITTYDGCLVAYPWADWVNMEEKFARIPNPSPKVRSFRRLVVGGAEVQMVDAQGRVRLSQDHREYAGLDKDVTIIGLINRFEIWNPATLTASMDAQKLDDVTDELAASGIDFAL